MLIMIKGVSISIIMRLKFSIGLLFELWRLPDNTLPGNQLIYISIKAQLNSAPAGPADFFPPLSVFSSPYDDRLRNLLRHRQHHDDEQHDLPHRRLRRL
ncbi:hypothetical protein Pvag_pPag30362 (plasmid) [Pantoea vagans C9-1]|nr:hypothetical protein Pvag_pPag30362 [Pantoea vagans C9-1]